MLHDIWQAETREDAHKAFDLFVKTFEAKYPKATECLIKDREELMTFFDFPAQHWQSIRTSNPIESAFATIRHRTKRTKGCLSRDGMLHMMFKLGQCAEKAGANCAALSTSPTSSKASTSSTASSHQTQIRPPHEGRSNTRFDSSSDWSLCGSRTAATEPIMNDSSGPFKSIRREGHSGCMPHCRKSALSPTTTFNNSRLFAFQTLEGKLFLGAPNGCRKSVQAKFCPLNSGDQFPENTPDRLKPNVSFLASNTAARSLIS